MSETLTLRNETEFSFSANNATWEPDIERRCRRIRLRFTPEDINGHRYRHTNLLAWVKEHRSDLLSAVAALVSHWVREGCPPGPTPFTSFPEWGRVVGGILTACGLPDPCQPHEDSQSSGDQDTRAMRQFFALGHDRFGNEWTPKNTVYDWVREIEEVQELFDWIDFSQRRGLITFGKLLTKFDGRELGGIVFGAQRTSVNYCKYRFFRDSAELVQTPHTPHNFDGDSPEGAGTPHTPHTAPHSNSVMCDVVGCFPSRSVCAEKSDTKTENRNELNGAIGEDPENLTQHHTPPPSAPPGRTSTGSRKT